MAPSSKKRSRNGSSKNPKKTRKRMAKATAPKIDSVGFNEDYNIRSPERTQLLNQIKKVIGNSPVCPAFWAGCQLADLSCLQDMAKSSRGLILQSDNSVCALPMQWTQRIRDSEFPGSDTASRPSDGPKRRKVNSDAQSLVLRSAKAVANCKERDGYQCALTKMPVPQAAHIFPYCMLNPRPKAGRNRSSNAIPEFWRSLNVFWDQDRIDKWKNTIFSDPENPDIGVERCFNLISLSLAAHDMWNRGLFALKPLELSPDRKELTVQFFWQVQGKYEIDSQVDLLVEPTSSKGLDFVKGYYLHLMGDNGPTRPIRSGDVFTFTTKDPEKLPLPSVELLEMQWFLQRLVGMSGAAGWPILELDDDSGDDGGGWLIPDQISDVYNSLKRVSEWVGTDITPETATPTTGPSVIECH